MLQRKRTRGSVSRGSNAAASAKKAAVISKKERPRTSRAPVRAPSSTDGSDYEIMVVPQAGSDVEDTGSERSWSTISGAGSVEKLDEAIDQAPIKEDHWTLDAELDRCIPEKPIHDLHAADLEPSTDEDEPDVITEDTHDAVSTTNDDEFDRVSVISDCTARSYNSSEEETSFNSSASPLPTESLVPHVQSTPSCTTTASEYSFFYSGESGGTKTDSSASIDSSLPKSAVVRFIDNIPILMEHSFYTAYERSAESDYEDSGDETDDKPLSFSITSTKGVEPVEKVDACIATEPMNCVLCPVHAADVVNDQYSGYACEKPEDKEDRDPNQQQQPGEVERAMEAGENDEDLEMAEEAQERFSISEQDSDSDDQDQADDSGSESDHEEDDTRLQDELAMMDEPVECCCPECVSVPAREFFPEVNLTSAAPAQEHHVESLPEGQIMPLEWNGQDVLLFGTTAQISEIHRLFTLLRERLLQVPDDRRSPLTYAELLNMEQELLPQQDSEQSVQQDDSPFTYAQIANGERLRTLSITDDESRASPVESENEKENVNPGSELYFEAGNEEEDWERQAMEESLERRNVELEQERLRRRAQEEEDELYSEEPRQQQQQENQTELVLHLRSRSADSVELPEEPMAHINYVFTDSDPIVLPTPHPILFHIFDDEEQDTSTESSTDDLVEPKTRTEKKKRRTRRKRGRGSESEKRQHVKRVRAAFERSTDSIESTGSDKSDKLPVAYELTSTDDKTFWRDCCTTIKNVKTNSPSDDRLFVQILAATAGITSDVGYRRVVHEAQPLKGEEDQEAKKVKVKNAACASSLIIMTQHPSEAARMRAAFYSPRFRHIIADDAVPFVVTPLSCALAHTDPSGVEQYLRAAEEPKRETSPVPDPEIADEGEQQPTQCPVPNAPEDMERFDLMFLTHEFTLKSLVDASSTLLVDPEAIPASYACMAQKLRKNVEESRSMVNQHPHIVPKIVLSLVGEVDLIINILEDRMKLYEQFTQAHEAANELLDNLCQPMNEFLVKKELRMLHIAQREERQLSNAFEKLEGLSSTHKNLQKLARKLSPLESPMADVRFFKVEMESVLQQFEELLDHLKDEIKDEVRMQTDFQNEACVMIYMDSREMKERCDELRALEQQAGMHRRYVRRFDPILAGMIDSRKETLQFLVNHTSGR